MYLKSIPLIGACLLSATIVTVRAGDAVAVGHNAAGVWTAVTYYCSGTPKGGADYKDAAGAREAALRDLRKRAGEGLARESVLSSSDKTGHFAYARAKTSAGKDMHAVGYGASPASAEKDAFQQLTHKGATIGQKLIYKYFSNGADSVASAPAKRS